MARAEHPGVSLERLIQQRPAVDPLTSVEDAVRLMTVNAVGAVPVTKGGKLLGIFTERDVMSRVVMSRKDPVTTPVSAVMTSPVLTIEATATIEEAAAMMQSRHIRHLAIVDENGDLKGLVALRYLLFEKLGGLERKVDDLEAFIMTDGPGG
jgi:CBS domain-containing protein